MIRAIYRVKTIDGEEGESSCYSDASEVGFSSPFGGFDDMVMIIILSVRHDDGNRIKLDRKRTR